MGLVSMLVDLDGKQSVLCIREGKRDLLQWSFPNAFLWLSSI
jgi:hypothetical protein